MNKFGIKIWSTNVGVTGKVKELIDKKIFDYMELMVVPNSDISPFERVKVPYIIHIAHEDLGLNIGNKNDINLKFVNESIKWADRLSAKYLIIHPGFGSMKTAKNFLANIDNKKILIENMPKIGTNNEKMVGFSVEQIKELRGNKFGFCLDFGHAIKAAVSLKKDYKEYIKELMSLDPQVIHISDGIFDGRDEHLNIGEGEYDFNFLAQFKAEYITLETPKKDFNSTDSDLKNINKLKLFYD